MGAPSEQEPRLLSDHDDCGADLHDESEQHPYHDHDHGPAHHDGGTLRHAARARLA